MTTNGATIVTGMHRSGTSMIASLLNEMGLSFGDPNGFFKTDEWNARGYYEQKDVMDVNSLILTGFHRNRGQGEAILSKVVYNLTPPNWLLKKNSAKYEMQLSTVAKNYKGRVIKDPRFCLTLPFWSESLPIEKVVVCIRHPNEVVQSLQKREKYPHWLGYRFWNYHVEHLLKNVDFSKAVVINFNELLGGDYERELRQLHSAFNTSTQSLERVRDAYQKRIDPTLVRCRQMDEHLSEKTKVLWEKLSKRHEDSLKRYCSN